MSNPIVIMSAITGKPQKEEIEGYLYDLRSNGIEQVTRIPWGRGNGWVLFSLSELLLVIPKEHKHYEEIKGFFVQLSQGFWEQIDEVGMLHQVLWDHESYAEASCTAMCGQLSQEAFAWDCYQKKFTNLQVKSALRL